MGEENKQTNTPFFLWASWFVAMDLGAFYGSFAGMRKASLRMRPPAETSMAMERMESEPLGWANLEALPPPYLPLGFHAQAIWFLNR